MILLLRSVSVVADRGLLCMVLWCFAKHVDMSCTQGRMLSLYPINISLLWMYKKWTLPQWSVSKGRTSQWTPPGMGDMQLLRAADATYSMEGILLSYTGILQCFTRLFVLWHVCIFMQCFVNHLVPPPKKNVTHFIWLSLHIHEPTS